MPPRCQAEGVEEVLVLEVPVDDALEEEVDDVLDESELLLVDSLLVLLDVALEEVDDPELEPLAARESLR